VPGRLRSGAGDALETDSWPLCAVHLRFDTVRLEIWISVLTGSEPPPLMVGNLVGPRDFIRQQPCGAWPRSGALGPLRQREELDSGSLVPTIKLSCRLLSRMRKRKNRLTGEMVGFVPRRWGTCRPPRHVSSCQPWRPSEKLGPRHRVAHTHEIRRCDDDADRRLASPCRI